jgi:hypothetical protein
VYYKDYAELEGECTELFKSHLVNFRGTARVGCMAYACNAQGSQYVGVLPGLY